MPPKSVTVRTRVAYGPRDPERFPSEMDALGRSLYQLIEGVVREQGKLPRPCILGIRDELVERYDLPGIVQSGGDVHAFTAAVAGQAGVEVVAIVGVLGVARGRDRERLPGLCVFVEWPDGRWWNALRIVRDARLHEEMPVMIRTADEGYPRPGGLGGWWSRSRFQGLSLRISRSGGQAGAGLVH
jgi:hypothetical protein